MVVYSTIKNSLRRKCFSVIFHNFQKQFIHRTAALRYATDCGLHKSLFQKAIISLWNKKKKQDAYWKKEIVFNFICFKGKDSNLIGIIPWNLWLFDCNVISPPSKRHLGHGVQKNVRVLWDKRTSSFKISGNLL